MKSYETEQGNKVDTVPHAQEDAQDALAAQEIGEVEETGEEAGVVDLPEDEIEDAGPSQLAVPGRAEQEEDEDGDEEPRRPRFHRPTREQVIAWLPFIAVVLLGAILRYWNLGAKPLHHDESLHAYFSLQLLHDLENWLGCYAPGASCYTYNPLLHGPFQFHLIAFVYRVSQLLGAPDNGVNTTTVRIGAATLGSAIVFLPYFLRDFLGKVGAWLAAFLLAVSPSMVYFSRFAREDIYMAFFTLLMVVAAARYIRTRKMRWILIGAAAFSLSYATAEATFLTIAIFGSFLIGLLIWEIGLRIRLNLDEPREGKQPWYLPRTGAPFLLLLYILVAGIAAKILFGWLEALSVYITDPKHTTASNLFVENLKNITVDIIPWLGILLGIYVLAILWREMNGKMPPEGRRGLAAKLNPRVQRTLDTILTMPWTHWFFAVLVAWAIFLDLFTVQFTNIRGGIGDGIWAGIYYWLQQQEVARGGQPWYYYLMLIPLYEQIGLVFGIVGGIRCLVRPTRFRLFLVYWTVGNLVIYSWAAEKMPWLMIFITMPMMLLAAIGLEPIVITVLNFVKQWFARTTVQATEHPVEDNNTIVPALPPRPLRKRVGVLAGTGAILGLLAALLLLVPTLHNMYEVSYVEPADGPHDMMIYVQTTTDINIVMAKVNALDQKLYGGKHLLSIGLTNDATWPYAWYLRDYTNVCFNYPDGCPAIAKDIPVIITGGDDIGGYIASYQKGYAYQQYRMRTWWDEGYKPPPCIPSAANNNCADQQQYGGVGLWLWLSYGDNPPPNAKFNLSLAIQHIWQWETQRRAIGSTDGSYDMLLFIRKDLVSTGVTP